MYQILEVGILLDLPSDMRSRWVFTAIFVILGRDS